MARVELSSALRVHARGLAHERCEGSTVGEVLRALTARHASLASVLFAPNGSLQRTIGVFVDDEDVRDAGGLERTLGPEDVVVLISAMSGG